MSAPKNITKEEQEALNQKILYAAVDADIDAMVKEGADVNTKDSYGWTPIHLVVVLKAGLKLFENLVRNGADVNTKDSHGWTPLHTACSKGYAEYIKILLKTGANPNIVNDAAKLAPDYNPEYFDYKNILALFMEAVDQDEMDSIANLLKYYSEFSGDAFYYAVLQNKTNIAKYIASQELPVTKITHDGFARLLGNRSAESQIIVKDLLDSYGFNHDLSGLRFNASTLTQVERLDFSGLNLISSKLHQLPFNQTVFINANLTNANIVFVNTQAVVNFASSDLSGAYIQGLNLTEANVSSALIQNTIVFNSSLYRDMIPDKYRAQVLDLKLDTNFSFYQGSLIELSGALNEGGVCMGLVIEYTIYELMGRREGEKNSDFIAYLKHKIEEKDIKFLYLIQSYQKHLQANEDLISMDIENIRNYNFIASLPEEVRESEVIGCYVAVEDAAHIFSLSRFKDSNNSILYKIFDPNWGEFSCVNEQDVNKQINIIFQYYQASFTDREGCFRVQALDQLVIKHDLIPSDGLNSIKEKRYSFISEKENFYITLEDKKASADSIQEAINIINSMSLEEINAPIKRGSGSDVSLLILASEGDHSDIIKLLLDKDADVNIGSSLYNNTALHTTAFANSSVTVEILIQHKANIDAQNKYGITALSLAVYYNHTIIATSLIKHGANPYLIDDKGKNSIDIKPEWFADAAILKIYQEALDNNDSATLSNLFKYHHSVEIQSEVLAYAMDKDIVENLPEDLKAMIEVDQICYNLFFLPYLANHCEDSFY